MVGSTGLAVLAIGDTGGAPGGLPLRFRSGCGLGHAAIVGRFGTDGKAGALLSRPITGL
jgi:hypothetical protein